jgi:hypothetical protein
VDIDRATAFLRVHHRAVLATARADGRPQLSPVAANMARDPRVSLCVFTDQFFGEWIQAEGTAEIVHLPEALDLLVDYYRRIAGEHPDWDDYREAMRRERRVMVRVTITRAGPDQSG